MQFPEYRGRRLRKNENLRRLVRETKLCVDDLVYPLFAVPGKSVKKPITAMPGQFQLSVDYIAKEAREAHELGVPAVLLFGIPSKKDEQGTGAFAKDGIVQQAVKRIKNEVPDMIVITDVCLCEYTSHGHCGILEKGSVQNDTTLEVLAETALSQARAGADMVAPSAMMDGQIGAIREALDENALEEIPIMAYCAKYASSFYGPFREAPKVPLSLVTANPTRWTRPTVMKRSGNLTGCFRRCGHHHGEAGAGLPGYLSCETGIRSAARGI